MCLATAGVILAIHDRAPEPSAFAPDPLWRSADVDFGGVRQQVSLACLPEAVVGDRVLVHVGVALSLVHDGDSDAAGDAVDPTSAPPPPPLPPRGP